MPYRATGDGADAAIQILLITSRESRRWVIPKGNLAAGVTPHQAAATEAEEEAGVVGPVCPTPLGSYRYRKRRRNGASLMVDVEVFPLAVSRELLITPGVVFGALVGAMVWNVVTWLKGIPSSSSHALVGGLVGAGVAHAGVSGVQWSGLEATLLAIVLSPLLGMVLSMLIMLATSWLFRDSGARSADSKLRYMHLASSAAYSISHGLNDAQKTMGIITVLLYSTGYLTGEFHVPHWVAIACYIAIALGTMTGGWKIIETMGSRITKLSQHQGFSASMGGSIVVFSASALGIPVSTTHTITGCVIGAGTARRASAVRWGVAQNVMIAWIITIPASAAVGALFYLLTRLWA